MINELKTKGIDVTDFNSNPVIYTILETCASQIQQEEYSAEDIRKHFFTDDAEGGDLDKRLDEKGLQKRFPGQKARGYILLKKSTPFILQSTIFKDMIFTTLDKTIQVSVLENTDIIPNTTQTKILCECTEIGQKGNLLPGVKLIYSGVAISEVEEITVDEHGFDHGAEMESDDSVRQRIHDFNRKQILNGNKSSYVEWAKQVSGVGDAKCISIWNGPGTVKVVIIDINKEPASKELISAVQEYLDPNSTGIGDGVAPPGAKVTVTTADKFEINISAKLILKSGYTLGQVVAMLKDSISKYLKTLVYKDDTIRYTYIENAIYNAEGVLDYYNCLLNGSNANLTIPNESIPVIGSGCIWTT